MGERAPWYAATGGVHFRCTQCGKCCARPGYIEVLPEEADALADRYRKGASPQDLEGELWLWDPESVAWTITVPEGGHCPFLVDGLCSVHDVKPLQCRTYPFWPEIVGRAKTWKEEARYCEGISDDGDLYTPSRIAQLLDEERSTNENE